MEQKLVDFVYQTVIPDVSSYYPLRRAPMLRAGHAIRLVMRWWVTKGHGEAYYRRGLEAIGKANRDGALIGKRKETFDGNGRR